MRAERPARAAHRLLAIGSSTGGTEALRQVLVPLPEDFPGIVITQHMPPGFTASFAARLDGLCRVRVQRWCRPDRWSGVLKNPTTGRAYSGQNLIPSGCWGYFSTSRSRIEIAPRSRYVPEAARERPEFRA